MSARTLLTFEEFEKYQNDGKKLHVAHGSEEVWIVYLQTRHIRAHFPDGHSQTLANDLRSALFPGWSARLDSIFPDQAPHSTPRARNSPSSCPAERNCTASMPCWRAASTFRSRSSVKKHSPAAHPARAIAS
jgi:hypothetical protein